MVACMNIYFVVILGTLLFSYALGLWSELLNLQALTPHLPAEFHGVYEDAAYRKSQEYTRVNTRFGFITATFDLVVMLIFWFTGGFPVLDGLVRSWTAQPILAGILYMLILMLAKLALGLPFTIYDTFVIEARFGFNQTTRRTFALDIVKGLGLSAVLGVPLLAGVLAFFEYAGANAWLYCWIAVTIFALVVQFIAPTWIMPLFNKFTPLADGELREQIFAYAQAVHFPLENLFVMDGSKRSTKSNAFFTGFGKHKRIALFDTLIAKHSVAELVAILAHEIGHYKKHHILQNLVVSVLHTGVMFYLLALFLTHQGLYDAFYLEQPSVYAGLIFFGMLYAPIELILSVALQIVSRHHEYAADRFAVETTRQPETFINALKTLSVHNLSNLTPHPVYVFLNYSHPPILARIQAIRALS